MEEVTGDMLVYQVLKKYPYLEKALRSYNICECAPFTKLEKEVELRKLDLAVVLKDLNDRIREKEE
jgi:hypothetical protein